MDKQYIQDNCKYLQFPSFDSKTQRFFQRTPNKLIDVNNLYNLPIVENMNYYGLKNNHHHFTTEYHRNHVLPKLNFIFDFGFNIDDFIIKNHIINTINDLTKKYDNFDLSYLIPKKNKFFKVISLEFDFEYECDFQGLLCNEKTKDKTWFSEYHELYCLPHTCSIVENLSSSNERTLLILGDSQMIPSLSVLCYYYKKVIYLDNRTTDKFYYESHLKNLQVDDILIEMFNGGLNYYLSHFR